MRAAVYYGKNDLRVEEVEIPAIGRGEVLVRISTCGICGTDLKKIHAGTISAPRIFGHEMAGTIEQVGEGVKNWKIGDRVAAYHHIPCKNCHYCRAGAFAQCETYKKVGTTAGYIPSGGGFAQYIKVMDWIVEQGLTRIPDDVSFAEASFLEPANTCLKAIKKVNITSGQTVLVIGQGPIGLLLLQLAQLEGARVFSTDLVPFRLQKSLDFGAERAYNVNKGNVLEQLKKDTDSRGVDVTIVATANNQVLQFAFDATRPAGKIMLFAQTKSGDYCNIDLAAICALEKELIGSYSASVDLNKEVEQLVFSKKLNVQGLITHTFELKEITKAINLALQPACDSLKVLVNP